MPQTGVPEISEVWKTEACRSLSLAWCAFAFGMLNPQGQVESDHRLCPYGDAKRLPHSRSRREACRRVSTSNTHADRKAPLGPSSAGNPSASCMACRVSLKRTASSAISTIT